MTFTRTPSQDATFESGAPLGAPLSACARQRVGHVRRGVWVIAAACSFLVGVGGSCAQTDSSALAPPDRTASPVGSLPGSTSTDGDASTATVGGPAPGPAFGTAPLATEPVPSSTSTTAPRPANLDHRGVDLGEACVDPALLLVAAEGLDVETAVSDLRSIRCFGDWATAWTNPVQDPVDPIDPEVLVFRRAEGAWSAWRIGESDCTAIGVPADVQLELDCY